MTRKNDRPRPSRRLQTPILAKRGDAMDWPEGERLFYLLARDGLFLCRQNEFFRSCVRASKGPSELSPQDPFLEPKFPEIPGDVVERAVGFFARIAELHGSEAAALLVWNRSEQRVRLVVPPQVATMGGSRGGYRYPIGVNYEPPTDLPEEEVVFGDIHCHVDYAAYASHVDKQDELHSAGLHIVVGRIREEPPEFHVEAVVDGQRFVLRPSEVFSGYRERRVSIPSKWIEQVAVEQYKWSSHADVYYSDYGDSHASADD